MQKIKVFEMVFYFDERRDFSSIPMKQTNRFIFIARRQKKNVSIGWTEKILLLKKRTVII
jgi:hypothetical protein